MSLCTTVSILTSLFSSVELLDGVLVFSAMDFFEACCSIDFLLSSFDTFDVADFTASIGGFSSVAVGGGLCIGLDDVSSFVGKLSVVKEIYALTKNSGIVVLL